VSVKTEIPAACRYVRTMLVLLVGAAAMLTLAGCGSSSGSGAERPPSSTSAATTATQPESRATDDAREPLTERQAERLGEHARERIDTQAAAFTAIAYFSKVKDWPKVQRAIDRTLRDIRPARSEFLAFADYRETKPIYARLVAADDAMRKYVAIYDADPPPFAVDEFDKATRLSDAAAEWVRALRAAYRKFGIKPPAPLRQPRE
jgi:hypothetical protein